jgi:hypothetical protein
MSWLPRQIGALGLAAALAALLILAQPAPEPARAGVVCDLGGGAADAISGGIGAITGAPVGGGNPVGDACNAVSGGVSGIVKKPLGGALAGVSNGIFEQITEWVSEGTAWLIAEVVKGIEKTTTPQLTAKGFLSQYGKMATIAALLGMAMLFLAVLEGVAQGNAGLLLRVALVNVPLAFIATSVAYLVVQLLLVATDGLCDAIASAGGKNAQHFFDGAIKDLGGAGSAAGSELGGAANPASAAAGAAAVPLFVTFLAAVIGAFAAFLVWLELIMRDAAVYVVALFMPFSLAASIWPRWSGALHRSVELLLVVISSKFVIVAIIALAASLLADPGQGIEPILSASALMLLACFAPFILLKLVPFAEGAMSAAYSRRSSAGGGVGAVQTAGNAQLLRNMAQSNWSDSGVTLWNAGGSVGGGSPGSGPGASRGGAEKGSGTGAATRGADGGSVGAGSSGGVGGAGSAASVGAAGAAPVAATRGAEAAAQKLAGSSVAQEAGATPPGAASSAGEAARDRQASAGTKTPDSALPPKQPQASGGAPGDSGASQASEKTPRPAPEQTGVKPQRGER